MRTTRIFRPLPVGKGFFMGRLIAALSITAMFAAVPAQAANVTVGFGLSAGAYAPTGAACQLSVPSGSDGEVVLAAAKAQGCIASYKVERHPTFGAFLTCVNEVCGETATGFFLTYWKFYENGRPAPYGISAFQARQGSELVFAYATWAGCVVSTDDPLC